MAVLELTLFTNPTVHPFHIPQCTIQDRNVHISVLNGALWDMEQVHCGICEIILLEPCHLIKSVQLILRSFICRFHLQLPDLQWSNDDSTRMRAYQDINTTIGHQVKCTLSNNLSQFPIHSASHCFILSLIFAGRYLLLLLVTDTCLRFHSILEWLLIMARGWTCAWISEHVSTCLLDGCVGWLKQKACHVDCFIITWCIEGCHIDSLQCIKLW